MPQPLSDFVCWLVSCCRYILSTKNNTTSTQGVRRSSSNSAWIKDLLEENGDKKSLETIQGGKHWLLIKTAVLEAAFNADHGQVSLTTECAHIHRRVSPLYISTLSHGSCAALLMWKCDAFQGIFFRSVNVLQSNECTEEAPIIKRRKWVT